VELLTLSACNTAATQSDAQGKEIDGFAELAQRLGAGSVMATLWQVSDDSTPWLMKEFYSIRQSNGGATKAGALRNAQLALLRVQPTPNTFPECTKVAELPTLK
jgi:CHAT domain-containing protein